MAPSQRLVLQTGYEAQTLAQWGRQVGARGLRYLFRQRAMGQNPNRTPSEHQPIPSKIGSKMGGEFTYPKMGSRWL